jgi:plasmid stabilization system protein ParE
MTDDYILLPRATKDVRAAFRYYSARSPSAARHFLKNFESTIERILRFPHSFGRRDVIHRFAKIKMYPYLILFPSVPVSSSLSGSATPSGPIDIGNVA